MAPNLPCHAARFHSVHREKVDISRFRAGQRLHAFGFSGHHDDEIIPRSERDVEILR
jgi:hypothetical protein